jgi:RNA polymerase sigma-54 factor
MKLGATITMKQELKLRQILSPQLIQMLKTFHMPYSELLQSVEEATQDNVLLEVTQSDQLLDYAYKNIRKNSDTQQKDFSEFLPSYDETENIYDYLTKQLKLEHLGKKEYELAKILIENIDDRGYLANFYEIRDNIVSKQKTDPRKIKEALRIIQSFEPDGIGARDLKECLLIQVDNYQFESEKLRSVIKIVIQKYLEDLSQEKYQKIATKLKLEIDGVKVVHDFIKNNLNPNPGNLFKNNNTNHFVIPSFELFVEGNKITINNLEQKYGIKINISQKQLALLKDPSIDEATKTYLKERLQKAKELVNNIEKRYENLEKLVSYIIERQSNFAFKGPIYLEPLLQGEVANYLNISPSTVSRIVNTKYIQTPYGAYPLKQLCPRSHFGKTQERLRLIVRDVLEKHPNKSDDKISKILKNDGIDIARRTVTKYRHLVM